MGGEERLPRDRRCVVVAESFSGPIGIRLAADPPPGLAGVMLVATFARNPVRVPRWLAAPFVPALAHLPASPRLAAVALLGRDAPADIVALLTRAREQVRPDVFAARLREVLTVDVRDALTRARVPLACLRATRDRVVPARAMAEIQRACSDVEVTEIDAPHLVLQTRPGPATREIIAFADRCLGHA